VWKAAPATGSEAGRGADVLILAGDGEADLALGKDVAALLPEAKLVVTDASPSSDLGRGTWSALLSAEPSRRRLVVLWGASVRQGAEEALALDERITGLFQAAAESGPGSVEVTIVTRGAKAVVPSDAAANWAAAGLGAIGLVAVNEFDTISCRCLDLPAAGGPDEAAHVVTELSAGLGEAALRDGQRFEMTLAPRGESEETPPVTLSPVDQPVELRLPPKGRLDALRFELSTREEPGTGEIEIRIHQSSLNYKDLLKADGRIHPGAYEDTFNEADFGMECAGVVVRAGAGSRFRPGQRVLAILTRGFRSYATVPEEFALPLPDALGMEAAAIPVVYLAAYHGLGQIAHLQAGERVLIHHATGGLGLAAVEIARWVGAEIYATAGSEEKVSWLHRHGIERVYSSRTLDFGRQIREATGGEGIDVVIGAQTGQAMHVSLGLLRTGGRYIEIGKKDIAEDNGLPLRPFNRNLIFASVDMDRLAKERPEFTRQTLQKILDHFAKGDFKPGPVRIFPAREFRAAFEEMSRSRHIGKLLLDFSEGDVEISDESRPVIRPDGCYLVTGGTSGFGITIARWLAAQGAGKLVLVSRSGPAAPGIAEVVQALIAAGTQVEVMAADVTRASDVRNVLERCRADGFPLRGVVHGAMVLDDVLMAEQTADRFRRVFAPKVAGAVHLAEALAGDPALDFLIFSSSISAVIGNRGQTSYVAANAVLDGLAHHLRAAGQPATSINWGALAESGVVARDANLGLVLSSAGITGLKNRQALSALARILRLKTPQIGVFAVDWEQWLQAHPHLTNDSRFRALKNLAGAGGAGDAAAQLRQSLEGATREQRVRAVEDHLREVLAATLKMSRDAISVNRKLNEMGVDSLLVLELSLGIKERIGVAFSAMEFLKGPSLRQLAETAEGRVWNN
jgi:NADPH:quinone reductase-like Zn-dependent oxidoreductase/acyl carrier protein